jgi:hypothetical protein
MGEENGAPIPDGDRAVPKQDNAGARAGHPHSGHFSGEERDMVALGDVYAVTARVVVALNLLRRDLEALELAADLAARRQAPLLALFVEDMNLANLSELPFAKEVGRISASERKLESLRLQRTVRAHAERIQRTLGHLTERLRIAVDFKTVRGHFMPTVFAEAGQVDILFLSRRTEAEIPPRRPLLRAAHLPPVWSVYDGSPESGRALRLALEFAGPDGSGLCVALPAESGAQFEALRRRALSLCTGNPPRFFQTEPIDGAKLLRRIRQTGCRLLVVKRHDGEMLGIIADAAQCPVVLV